LFVQARSSRPIGSPFNFEIERKKIILVALRVFEFSRRCAGRPAEVGTSFNRDASIVLGHCALHFGRAAHRIDDVAVTRPD
jgi:hypothetical protein